MQAPYINLNGNSKEDIKNQFHNMLDAVSNVISVMSESDYANGRNALDADHAKTMRAEKQAILQYMYNLQKEFIEVVKTIR